MLPLQLMSLGFITSKFGVQAFPFSSFIIMISLTFHPPKYLLSPLCVRSSVTYWGNYEPYTSSVRTPQSSGETKIQTNHLI